MIGTFHAQNRLTKWLPNQIPLDDASNLYWIFLEDESYITEAPEYEEDYYAGLYTYPYKRSGGNLYTDSRVNPGIRPTFFNSIINGIDMWYYYKPRDSYAIIANFIDESIPLVVTNVGNEFFSVIEVNQTLYTPDYFTVIYSILLEPFSGVSTDRYYASCWMDSTHIYFGKIKVTINPEFGGTYDIDIFKTVYDSYEHNFPNNTFTKVIISGNNFEVRLNGTQICSYSMNKNRDIIGDLDYRLNAHLYFGIGAPDIFSGPENFNAGLNGYSYETLFYPRLLNTDEISRVENYLNDKYNIY